MPTSAAALYESSPAASLRHELRACESLEAFRAIEPQWRTLSTAADGHSPFISFAYCEAAVARALASGATIEVATVHDAHELLALWPVAIVRKGGLRTAQAPGCGCGEEYGGPLIADTRRAELYAVALQAVMRIHADVLHIPMVENGSALQHALDAVPQSWVQAALPPRWRVMPGYSIGLRAYSAWNDFLATRHSTLRAALRSSIKRLRREGEVSFGWCDTVEETERVLIWLFANKRQWALKRGIESPYLMDDRTRDFFIGLAQKNDPNSMPLVACIQVNGQPVAASVNLVGTRTVEYLITTYDEAFSVYSVGNLLVEYIAQWAHAHGRDFDFRPLHGDYKARWADRETRHESRIVVLNARGRLIELALSWEQAKRVCRKAATVVAAHSK
ncbi:GNAT family N-acetyltransferase [Paraburkholderia lycopersici]|uniref:Acetyltransferase involved in cellulose biosynthesis, CelD/BcsL family n=1 Tax=Paraburkholderia lycopersici TaxID=416944 RepID=A0A1G6MPV1_9BURK|nr:GNAT family N-acetyltransferase [Paraburkholderia lycopersici]SDC57501.1 Acetyltransferase involved in cellulose biosynthesis, CelD/BcsL family [Paraburkholderia lycopersici]